MTVHCSRSRTTVAPAARCRASVAARSTQARSACARTGPVGSSEPLEQQPQRDAGRSAQEGQLGLLGVGPRPPGEVGPEGDLGVVPVLRAVEADLVDEVGDALAHLLGVAAPGA